MTGSTILTLALAILSEVGATSALKASAGFTRLWPACLTVAGYAFSFFCLSLTLRGASMGIVYGIWSGVGIVLISSVGWLAFGERLDAPALCGLGLIIAGVLVVNIWSDSVTLR